MINNPETFLAALLKTPHLVQARPSPNGQWVAWVWQNLSPVGDVFVAPTDGSAPARRLTDFKENTYVVSWSDNSQSLIVKHDMGGDERWQLYQVSVAGGEAKLVLTVPEGFINSAELSPDEKYLLYGLNQNVYRKDLTSGVVDLLVAPAGVIASRPRLNSLGNKIIYTRAERHPAGRQIWLVNFDGTEDQEILNFGDQVKVGASWLPDGERLIFTAEAATHRRVGLLMVATKAVEWLIDDPERNIEEAYVPFGSEQAVIIELKNAKPQCSLLRLDTKIEERISGPHNLLPLAPLADGRWLSWYYHSEQPAELVIHEPKATTLERVVTNVFNYVDYKSDDLVRAENYTWTSFDGRPIQGWLYRPRVSNGGTVVLVHGGPTHHSEDEFDAEIQYFVARGFTVFDPNYRGSTGFGLAFQELIKQSGWGGEEQLDLKTAIEALIKDGVATPGKIGMMGTSYGGYSSWHGITHWPVNIVAAAVPICGMTDLVVDYETTRPDLRGYSEEMMGGSPSEQPEKYFERSPLNFIKNIKGRLLIVQGQNDPNVTMENLTVAEAVLKKNKISYETLVFSDEGHGIKKPANVAVLLVKAADFFERSFGLAN